MAIISYWMIKCLLKNSGIVLRILIQRVIQAAVTVDAEIVGSIGKGALVFFAVGSKDSIDQTSWLAEKLVHLRMFADENDKMNLSILDIKGEVLIISQFTLYANCSKGRRPSFTDSANPDFAKKAYKEFIRKVSSKVQNVQTGIFGADMKVELINDGPVTFLMDA